MEIVKLERHHLGLIKPQKAQIADAQEMGAEMPEGDSWCALVDGKPVAAGGIAKIWTGRGHAWMLFSEESGEKMIRILRAIHSKIDAAQFRRLEMAVDCYFPQGIRMARMLGFELECKADSYFPNGNPAFLFVKIRKDK